MVWRTEKKEKKKISLVKELVHRKAGSASSLVSGNARVGVCFILKHHLFAEEQGLCSLGRGPGWGWGPSTGRVEGGGNPRPRPRDAGRRGRGQEHPLEQFTLGDPLSRC